MVWEADARTEPKRVKTGSFALKEFSGQRARLGCTPSTGGLVLGCDRGGRRSKRTSTSH